jgi:hypothetical protein
MVDPDLRRRGEAFNRTLRTVERDLERAYFGEAEVGPYDDPLGPGIVSDVLVASRSHDDGRDAALVRLRRAYRSDERLTRALANTTTTDVGGLLGALALPEWIVETVARRSGWAEILLQRLATVPLDFNAGYPWLPDLPPVTPAPELPATEKAEIDSATIAVGGQTVPPATIGRHANISWPAFASAGDVILVPLLESVTLGLAKYVLDEMEAAASSAADLETAFAALAAAGYVADLVVGSQAALSAIGAPLTAELRATGVDVLPALYVDGFLVASSSGIFAAIQERAAARTGLSNPETVDEPRIAGYGVIATRSASIRIGTGAVVKVAAS